MSCYQIRVLLFHGNENKRNELRPLLCKKNEVNGIPVCPVILTSFEIPLRERILRNIKWSYVVVDEGHRLKNYKSMLARYTEIIYNRKKNICILELFFT
jgi:SNF2 family DNA or RNA helicase